MDKKIDLKITHGSHWGHGFLSIRFAHFITHCFDIPVTREFKEGDGFELSVNGTSVYRKTGDMDTDQSPLFLIDLLSPYADPVRPATSETFANDKDDPDYREWMQSFCSGE